MKSCAEFIAEAKVRCGDSRMSDRALADRLGDEFRQQHVSLAKTQGYMTDTMALAIAKVLEIHPATILIVARAEREKTPEVKAALMDFVGKVLSRLPEKALGAFAALMVAGGLMLQPVPAEAGVGGAGRSRKPQPA